MIRRTQVIGPFRLVQGVGAAFKTALESVGRFVLFFYHSLLACFSLPLYGRQIFKQLYVIGFLSLPLIGLTAIFTGAVLALQSYTGFSRFSAGNSIASIVVLSITRELGPVLAGLMLAGRVSSSIAAEIATMRVSEQIDALYTLKVSPFHYLVAPRIIAGVVALPILVIIADIIGVFGGYLVAVHKLGFSHHSYLLSTFNMLHAEDVVSGLQKSVVFGLIVTLNGCYQGYNSSRGAQGVGNAAINSVVWSSILILLFNYLITELIFSK